VVSSSRFGNSGVESLGSATRESDTQAVDPAKRKWPEHDCARHEEPVRHCTGYSPTARGLSQGRYAAGLHAVAGSTLTGTSNRAVTGNAQKTRHMKGKRTQTANSGSTVPTSDIHTGPL
jgi:hypothetical protein